VRRVRLSRRLGLLGAISVVAILAVGVLFIVQRGPKPLSFDELARDASSVPLPAGLQFLSEQRSTNNGPGFSHQKFEEVTRTYRNGLSCDILEQRWLSQLAAAGRTARIDREPTLHVGDGQVEIVITDRPENLGITLGVITNKGAYIECGGPFIWAFNHLH
jgi:hypothetical protein